MFKWKIRGGPIAMAPSSGRGEPLSQAEAFIITVNIFQILIVIIHITVIDKVIAWYRDRLARREFEGKGKGSDEVSLLLS